MDSVVFRLCDKAPDILREVCLERGWEEYSKNECEAARGWNLWWKTQGFTSSEYENYRPWQRLNHFPKSASITKKDGLARNLRRMKTAYGGSSFEFFPLTFILPNEYKKFVAEFSKQAGNQGSNYWICKPTEQSCGRGIFIFQDLHDLTYDCAVVVQKYIIKPFLISGYKFDLRLYAIVKSFHPFQLYIYHEGIVRFSTERFDLSKLDNRFSHLTNTSINKTGPQYSTDKESIGVGCKWTLSQLRVYLYKHNIDDCLLWHRITSIIILTLLSQVHEIPTNSSNCFELFGFDILVDEKMKPWLLEVNFSPALGNDCTQDELVKRPLLNDILEILNFSEVDLKRGRKEKVDAKTKKKNFKDRDVNMHHVPQRVKKAISSKLVSQWSSKSSLNVSVGETQFDVQENAAFEGCKSGISAGLTNRKISRNLRQKGSASGDKTKKSIQRCQTPCSKYSLSYHKRLSTSEEFLKAAMDDCKGLEYSDAAKGDLKETKIPFDCATKDGDCAFKNIGHDIPLAEENQSFCLKQATEDENGLTGADLSEREGNITSPPRMVRGQRQMQSSMEFSRPEHKCNGQSSHLHMRRYNSEISPLNSLRTVDKHVLPHSSTGNFNQLSPLYSLKVSTKVQRSKKNPCVTLKPQIGNCILAFPFNEATFNAGQGRLDQKFVIEEIRKMLKAISSHIKMSPSEVSKDGNSLDLSKPFWGYRSKLNTFYSSLQPIVEYS